MRLARRLGRVCEEAGRDVAAVAPLRKFFQDYCGLNAITQRSVEPLLHIDQLVDETRGARFFTKLDLAMAYMQLTSFVRTVLMKLSW